MISKTLPGLVRIQLYEDEVEGVWVLEEAVDSQTYDRYNDAWNDYVTIVDSKTLTKVFGWSEDPYER